MVKLSTKPSQFETMVEFMEHHKEIAQGYLKSPDARIVSSRLWERLSLKLNAKGPPVRTAVQWKKVWADYKIHIKIKIRKNNQSMSGTRGGQNRCLTFTRTERRVIQLINLTEEAFGNTQTQNFEPTSVTDNSSANDSVEIKIEDINANNHQFIDSESESILPDNGNEPDVDLPATSTRNTDTTSANYSAEIKIDDINASNHQFIDFENESILPDNGNEPDLDLPATSTRNSTSSNSSRPSTSKNSLIQMQLENQKHFHLKMIQIFNKTEDNTATIAKYLKKIYDVQDKQYRLDKKKYELKDKMNTAKLRMHKDKLEMKKEYLHLKEKKYNYTYKS